MKDMHADESELCTLGYSYYRTSSDEDTHVRYIATRQTQWQSRYTTVECNAT